MEEATKFMVEKLKEAPFAVKILGVDALAWFNKVIPPEKIKQSEHALKNSGEVALGWVNLVFPPEKRSEKIKLLHKAKPYAIAALVLVVAVRLFGGRGGGAVKMMKAPGRKNYKISRPGFESNPRKYFGDLRAAK